MTSSRLLDSLSTSPSEHNGSRSHHFVVQKRYVSFDGCFNWNSLPSLTTLRKEMTRNWWSSHSEMLLTFWPPTLAGHCEIEQMFCPLHSSHRDCLWSDWRLTTSPFFIFTLFRGVWWWTVKSKPCSQKCSPVSWLNVHSSFLHRRSVQNRYSSREVFVFNRRASSGGIGYNCKLHVEIGDLDGPRGPEL